jgi:ribokinase
VSGARVVVVGSMNRDYVCRVASLPRPGETLLGGELSLGEGGKGGNQAVAASRFGGTTLMVGAVGADADGEALVAALREQGVDTTHVAVDAERPTGAAFVFVDPAGENSIVVAAGANSGLTASTVGPVLDDALRAGDVVVVQMEVPLDVVAAAAGSAVSSGGRLVLNLAPYAAVDDAVLAAADPLVVNESEAAGLLGGPVSDPDEAARRLLARCRSVVVTLGSEGAVVAQADIVERLPAERVDVVDSTGAGDAFTGVLAAELAAGSDLLTAARLGVAAGTYAVQRHGAQSSYPSRSTPAEPSL